MSGREDSVIERFRKDLRVACSKAGVIDMNAPANGSDRWINADEFFSAGEHFFIVEFKSSKYSLKSEDRKASACELCARLKYDSAARDLHDRAHFASWGTKEYLGNLAALVGVYRSLVCRSDVLPSCAEVLSFKNESEFFACSSFLQTVIDHRAGLPADKFASYLKWLFAETDVNGSPFEFPLRLFGYSYASGIDDKLFQSYGDFESWAKQSIVIQTAVLPKTPRFGP